MRPLRFHDFVVALVAASVAGVLYGAALAGCGATAAQRESYAIEQARCLANERAIVDRAGTSYEEDREALEVERARCDAALRAIYREE